LDLVFKIARADVHGALVSAAEVRIVLPVSNGPWLQT